MDGGGLAKNKKKGGHNENDLTMKTECFSPPPKKRISARTHSHSVNVTAAQTLVFFRPPADGSPASPDFKRESDSEADDFFIASAAAFMSLILQTTVFVLHFSRADGGLGEAGGAAAAVAVALVRGGKWQQCDVGNVTQKSIRRLTRAVALQLRVFSAAASRVAVAVWQISVFFSNKAWNQIQCSWKS